MHQWGMRSPRIVFLTDLPLELEHAPVSRLYHLASICAGRGMDAELIGCESPSRLQSDAFTITALPVKSPGKSQALVPFRQEVGRALKQADAVVVRGYFIASWVLGAARRQQVPLRMLDFHGSTWREKAGKPLVRSVSKWLEQRSFMAATHILSVSKGCAGDGGGAHRV